MERERAAQQAALLEVIFPPTTKASSKACVELAALGAADPDALPADAVALLPIIAAGLSGCTTTLTPHLKGMVRHQRTRRLLQKTSLIELQETLRGAGVDCVVLGGLAEWLLQPQRPHRAASQLELLVAPSRFRQAVELLVAEGAGPLIPLQSDTIDPHDPGLGWIPFRLPRAAGVRLHLHRRPAPLLPSHPDRVERLLAEAIPVPQTPALKVPRVEDRISLACACCLDPPGAGTGLFPYLADLVAALADPAVVNFDPPRLEWAIDNDTDPVAARALLHWCRHPWAGDAPRLTRSPETWRRLSRLAINLKRLITRSKWPSMGRFLSARVSMLQG
ncbi:nucleotidyltransferase family protein [Synechococcus sp. ATX 2A4]|uniref:nucleotidyltransferase family protein n=1 Tax=Synechococcus sp. ATX 2A4 TaxID=2823727 RepID=UPI0020CBDAA8|nr:nucleotidyltransferase family protein [Synechococcus sp. ATX 2A4]